MLFSFFMKLGSLTARCFSDAGNYPRTHSETVTEEGMTNSGQFKDVY